MALLDLARKSGRNNLVTVIEEKLKTLEMMKAR